MPHCGSILPICLSLRPVGSIHNLFCSPRADIVGPNCQSITPLYYEIFLFISWHYLSIYYYFLTEAAQYECSYRRTAHLATVRCLQAFISSSEMGNICGRGRTARVGDGPGRITNVDLRRSVVQSSCQQRRDRQSSWLPCQDLYSSSV